MMDLDRRNSALTCWAPGSRVTTLCALAGSNKKEYPAGRTGCVWEVSTEGVMTLCLDNIKGQAQLVKAEAGDLRLDSATLSNDTEVICHDLLLRHGGRHLIIPRGTFGVIMSYNIDTKKYKCKFQVSDARGSDEMATLTSWVPNTLVVPSDAFFRRSAREVLLPSVSFSSSLSSYSEGSDASSDLPPRVPQYSSLSGSPRTRSNVLGSCDGSSETLSRSVSFASDTSFESQLTPKTRAPKNPRKAAPCAPAVSRAFLAPAPPALQLGAIRPRHRRPLPPADPFPTRA
eukprot:TRINITY_DN9954_c0_g4_i1.p1 TRINITY_DN9954_c0_g4~~TRINITY_DN9954_c0_g4_i1.p1  ORF type:complete len:287 (+),score=62.00 TRINITY_DN9954_c0_g4_i1:47-907(+)